MTRSIFPLPLSKFLRNGCYLVAPPFLFNRWSGPFSVRLVKIILFFITITVFVLQSTVVSGQSENDARRLLFAPPRAVQNAALEIRNLLDNKDYARAAEKIPPFFLAEDDFYMPQSLFSQENIPQENFVRPYTFTQTLQRDLARKFVDLEPAGKDILLLATESLAEERYQAALRTREPDRRLLASLAIGFPWSQAGQKAAILLTALRLQEGQRRTTGEPITELLSRSWNDRIALEPTLSLLATESALLGQDEETALHQAESLFLELPQLKLSLDNRPIGQASELITHLREKIEQATFRENSTQTTPTSDVNAVPDSVPSPAEFPHLCWSEHLAPVEQETLKREVYFPSWHRATRFPGIQKPVLSGDTLVRYAGLTLVAQSWNDGQTRWAAPRLTPNIPESLAVYYRSPEKSANSEFPASLFDDCGSVFTTQNRTDAGIVVTGSRILTVESPLTWGERLAASTSDELALPLPELIAGNTLVVRDLATGTPIWSRGQIPYFNGLLARIAEQIQNRTKDRESTTEGEMDIFAESLKREQLGEIWFSGAPLVLNDSIYIIGEDEIGPSLYVLSLDDGRLIFQRRFAASQVPVSKNVLRSFSGITPFVADNILYCPGPEGPLAAFDFDTLRFRWFFVPQEGPAPNRPEKLRDALASAKMNPLTKCPLSLAIGPDGALLYQLADRNICYTLVPETGAILKTGDANTIPDSTTQGETSGETWHVFSDRLVRTTPDRVSVWSRSEPAAPPRETVRNENPVSPLSSDVKNTDDLSLTTALSGAGIVTLLEQWPQGEIDPVQRTTAPARPQSTARILPRLPERLTVRDDQKTWTDALRGPLVTLPRPEITDGTTRWRVDAVGQLQATDLASGKTFWSVAEGEQEIFTGLCFSSNRLFVRVATPDEERIRELNPTDGHLIGEKILPFGTGFMTGAVACVPAGETEYNVQTILGIQDETSDVLATVSSTDLILRLPEMNLLAFCSEQGKLTLIDTIRGEKWSEQEIRGEESSGPVTGFQVWRDQKGAVVLLWFQPQHVQRFSTKIVSVCDADEQIIEYGLCQRINQEGQTVWAQPVELFDTCYLRTQPPELPLILFAKRALSEKRGNCVAIRAIDKRTGYLCFNAKLPDCEPRADSSEEFPIFASIENEPCTLCVTCRNQEFLFQFKEVSDDTPKEEKESE